jgi:hypothetical protein
MKNILRFSKPSSLFCVLTLNLLVILLAGCASKPETKRPPHARGWVGGEYQLAGTPRFFGGGERISAFPKQLQPEREAGVLVVALSSNAPAHLAGLQEGDLVLDIAGKPVGGLKDFRLTIDETVPGTLLPFRVYRAGELLDIPVCVGRETFRYRGVFAIAFPPELQTLDLWPDPNFSLIALGYRRDHNRTELNSVEEKYRRQIYPDHHPADREWFTWLALFRLWKEKEILSQENVPAPAAVAAIKGD